MLADALPDVHKRVKLFKQIGKNQSLLKRFVAWVQDAMQRFRAFFTENPVQGLTKAQMDRMEEAFARLAGDMVDNDGKKIFKVTHDKEGWHIFDRLGKALEGGRMRPAIEGAFSFAGETAKTADVFKLVKAMRMAKDGKSEKEIYKETGWFKGKDDLWRFEIPDNFDKIKFPALKGTMKLSEVYKNPALYKAYPWLKDIPVKFDARLGQDTYGYADGEKIVLNPKLAFETTYTIGDEKYQRTADGKGWMGEMEVLDDDSPNGRRDFAELDDDEPMKVVLDILEVSRGDEKEIEKALDRLHKAIKNEDDQDLFDYVIDVFAHETIDVSEDTNIGAKTTLVHEIQHMIQGAEGFATGGTSTYARKKMREEAKKGGKDAKKLLALANDRSLTNERLYNRLAGEQEAREVEHRAKENYLGKEEVKRAKEALDEAKRRKASAEEIERLQFAYDDAKSYYDQQANAMPRPHGTDAIVLFGGEEVAGLQASERTGEENRESADTENQDERPAGNQTAAANDNNKLGGRLRHTNILSRVNDKMAYETVQGLILRWENAVAVNALSVYKRLEKEGKGTQNARRLLVDAIGNAVGRRRALNDARAAAYVGRFLRRNGQARAGSYLAEDVRRIIDAGGDSRVLPEGLKKKHERYNEYSGEHKQTFDDPIVDEIIAEIGEKKLNEIADAFLPDLEEQGTQTDESRSEQGGFSDGKARDAFTLHKLDAEHSSNKWFVKATESNTLSDDAIKELAQKYHGTFRDNNGKPVVLFKNAQDAGNFMAEAGGIKDGKVGAFSGGRDTALLFATLSTLTRAPPRFTSFASSISFTLYGRERFHEQHHCRSRGRTRRTSSNLHADRRQKERQKSCCA